MYQEQQQVLARLIATVNQTVNQGLLRLSFQIHSAWWCYPANVPTGPPGAGSLEIIGTQNEACRLELAQSVAVIWGLARYGGGRRGV